MKIFTRQLHRDEEGVTLVIVALSLVALFGMLVLVVDVGGLLWKRREMVNGSDSAALAAAQTCSVPLTSDPTDPEAQADNAAIANVSGLNAADGSIVAGGSTCRQSRGYVTVQYSVPQQLFFAPVLGFGKTNPVTTAATAAWGPLGGGNAVPIVLDSGQFQGPCQIPDNVTIGDLCPFWYNNGSFNIGDANWGFLSLDPDQWGVEKDDNTVCSNVGASTRDDWILYNSSNTLLLKDPAPTYVCNVTGHATDNWQSLVDRMNCDPNSATPTYANCPGSVMLMPVNDCTKQVDKTGNIVACGAGTPDKYAIIGFTSLELSGVYKGNDPLAIGTPGTVAQTGDCGNAGKGLTIPPTKLVNLGSFADLTCGGPDYATNSSRYHVPAATVAITSKQGNVTTTYVQCPPIGGTGCDYRYNESNSTTSNGIAPLTMQWVRLGAVPSGLTISLDWTVDGTAGTPGYCGLRQSDPNALCLVTTWLGYTSKNAPIGSGPNEGTKGFILCDFTYNSCPAGVKP